MTEWNTMEVSSLSLETKCGWKGVLKSSISIIPTYSLWGSTSSMDDNSDRTHENNIRSSPVEVIDTVDDNRNKETVTSTMGPAVSAGEIPSLQEISTNWMGGEPPKYDIDVEHQGVLNILTSLSKQEREEMQSFDMSMPIRHFRAEKGDESKAINQIRKTLAWRKEFGVDVIVNCFSVANTEHDTNDHADMRNILIQENKTGKIYTRGYDSEGRALFYMTPARENTNNELNNMRHLVWNLEKAIACTARQSVQIGASKKPLEKINLMIDYDAFKLSNAPPMSTTKYTLEILQKHYPERMKHAYLLHPPLVFRAFWTLIKSFVDPITKEKIVFCSGIEGRSKLTNNITTKDKLEVRSYGSDPNIRDFDSSEFLWLPFDVSFDE